MADNITTLVDEKSVRTLEDASSVHWPAGVCAYATSVGTPDVLEVVTTTAGLPVQPQTGATWAVTDGGGSLTVDGSVSVTGSVAVTGTFWQTTQPVSGTVSIGGTASVDVAQYGGSAVGASNALHVQPGTGAAFPVTDNGGSLTVDGTVSVTGSVAVTGTFWQATQPVSIAAAVAVTDNGGSLTVDDGGSSLTIDGTVSLSGTSSVNISQYGGATVGAANAVHVQPGTSARFDSNAVVTTLSDEESIDTGGYQAIRMSGWSADAAGWVGIKANWGGSLLVEATGAVTAYQGFAPWNIQGHIAVDAAVGTQPVIIGGRASTNAPSAVNTDGDAQNLWLTRDGMVNVVLRTTTGSSCMNTPYSAVNALILDGNGSQISSLNPLYVRTNSLTPLVTTAVGTGNLVHGQVSVGTTANGTTIAASRSGRRRVTVTNHGTTDVFLGASGVTTSTGLLLQGVKGTSVTLETTAEVRGIVAAGSQTVSYLEEY